MHFVFDDGATTRELEAVLHNPDALVADLVAALRLDGPDDRQLVVDGRVLPAGRRLDRAGITDGAVVRLSRSGERCSDPHRVDQDAVCRIEGAIVAVEVIGGLDAGRRRLVGPGSWSVGRVATDVVVEDPTVSAIHVRCQVAGSGTVTLSDQESLNGTWVDDQPVAAPTVVDAESIVRLGASQLQFGPAISEDRPLGLLPGRFSNGCTIPFNRPPRQTRSPQHEPIDPPTRPADAIATSAVGVISVIAPLVLGLVMVKVFHNWLYGMFALLSPVMLIGNVIESKHRGRRTRRKDGARYAEDLAAFVARLAELAAAERALRIERSPAPPEIVRRATTPSTRLWERRPGHDDFLLLRTGLGPVPWEPPVEGQRRTFQHEVRQAIVDASVLAATPVEVDLTGDGVVGIFGPRSAALALARSLLAQAATLHGPGDLPIAIFAAPGQAHDWDWAKWLPHTGAHAGSAQRMLAADRDVADDLLRRLLERSPSRRSAAEAFDQQRKAHGPTLLVVVDDESLTEGRRSPARSVLKGMAGPVAGIVVARSEDRLPALCSTVIEVAGEEGQAVVHRPETGGRVDDVLLCGMTDQTARMIARALARSEDPELDVAGLALPREVALLPLLALDPPTPEAILDRWQAGGADPDLVAPIGVAEDGVLALDLMRDGPHALVAGTTGSGKSELLRSLVAGLAAGCSPKHLTFVLIDFKGGSAFDQCARLPHTVGMVTDLDEHLGARALRCLEAELRHRERRLRAAGVADLKAYRDCPAGLEAMPRLVVVIDEFATLRNELPDFVDALVGVAQRGRSLGVHLVLATQRPSGAVSENIRANTNLRIALRVQDANDSQDVIDLPDAASIGRNQPGRALARLGPGEVVALQIALSTGIARPGGHEPVEIRPFEFGPTPPPGSSGSSGTSRTTNDPAVPPREPVYTDLARLVEAVGAAFDGTGSEAPRRPWPEPLADRVDLDSLMAGQPGPRFATPGATLTFALADLPDQQTQQPAGWVPADGNLLLVGIGGSGTTTALCSIALAAAAANDADHLHLYVFDFGAGELAPLTRLPHTGAVIGADESERQSRLMRHLKDELIRRRALPDPRATEPRILVLLDGVAGFRATWDETDPAGLFEDLVRVFADGPEVGVHLAVSSDRPGAMPNALSGLARQRLIFRLGDRLDYGIYGLSARDVPDLTPGGAILAETSTEVRIGLPTPDIDTAVGRLVASTAPGLTRPPPPVRELPRDVDPLGLACAVDLGEHQWFVPIGVGDATLGPVGLTLYDGEHALVAGPPRSGRTTTLQTIASVIRAAKPDMMIVAIAGARSALASTAAIDCCLAPDGDETWAQAFESASGPLLILVDDAELVDDSAGDLQAMLDQRRPGLHVVGAGRTEALRGLYGHWTRTIRASRNGLLLQPDPDLDGDLFGARLPRRPPVTMAPGRGYLITGQDMDVVQIARPAGN